MGAWDKERGDVEWKRDKDKVRGRWRWRFNGQQEGGNRRGYGWVDRKR